MEIQNFKCDALDEQELDPEIVVQILEKGECVHDFDGNVVLTEEQIQEGLAEIQELYQRLVEIEEKV